PVRPRPVEPVARRRAGPGARVRRLSLCGVPSPGPRTAARPATMGRVRYRTDRNRIVAAAVVAVAVALVGAACTGSRSDDGTPPPTGGSLGIVAPRIDGWLHTDGTRIVDAGGTTVRMVGINVKGMSQGTGTPLADLPAGTLGCLGWSPPPDAELRNIRAWG